MGDLWYLALAYGVIWVVLLAYLYSLARRQAGLDREVKAVQEALEGGLEVEEAEDVEPFLSLIQGEGARSPGEKQPDG